ncbi:MAG: histidine kinase N-terminal 7TM domain-containing protein, partial [Anaerolineae bacterium]
AFSTVVVAILVWTISYALEITLVSLPTKIFWAKIQYLGILTTPAFWLIFMLRYTKRDHLVSKRYMILLFAPLFFFLALVWTNEHHLLVWASTTLDETGVFREPAFGPGFWFMMAYLYITTLLASLALLNSQSRSPGMYRWQAVMLLVATFAPMVASLMTISGLNPLAPLDLTPMSFIISSVAWLYGRTRLRLLDMLPVARATLVEKLTDGVLVLDTQNRVLDLNPAAQRILGVTSRQAIGHDLGQLLPQVVAQFPDPDSVTDDHLELNLVEGNIFDANLIALLSNDGELYGRILTLHDISESKKNQADLTRSTERLQLAQEIDRAILTRQVPNEIAETALHYLRQLVPVVNRASVLTFDFETGQATILAADTDADTKLSSNQKVPLASLPMMADLAQNKYHLVNDVDTLVSIGPIGQKLAQEGIKTFLHVPLLIQDQLIGSLNFGSEKANAFSDANIEMAQEIANSLAIAIHQARLSEQTHLQTEQLRRRERYLIRLNEITRTAVSQLESQAMLQTLADSMLGFEYADNCYITIYDETRQLATFTAVSGQERPAFSIIRARPDQVLLIESVLSAGHPLPIFDVHNTPYVSPEVAAKFPSKSVLALPLIVGKQKLGSAIIGFNQPHQFTEDEVQYGAQAAAQISLALSKTHILEKEREQRQLAEMLQETGAALSATLDVNSLLARLLDQLQRLVPHDRAAVMLVQNGRVTISHHRGYNTSSDEEIESQINRLSFSLEETPNLKQMAASGRPLIIPDIRQMPDWIQTSFTQTVRSWAGAPILQAGEVTAFFSVDKAEVDFYQPWHASRMAALANQASLALENARLYEEAQRQLDELMALHEVAAVGNEARSVDQLVDW